MYDDNDNDNETDAERNLRQLKLQARLSTFFAAVTACSSLYIVGSIQTGGTFNLSSKNNVEEIFTKAVKNDPKLNTPAIKAEIKQKAEKAEDDLAAACAIFSLWGGIGMTIRDSRYRRALANKPK